VTLGGTPSLPRRGAFDSEPRFGKRRVFSITLNEHCGNGDFDFTTLHFTEGKKKKLAE
jgi:hypothetical protein